MTLASLLTSYYCDFCPSSNHSGHLNRDGIGAARKNGVIKKKIKNSKQLLTTFCHKLA